MLNRSRRFPPAALAAALAAPFLLFAACGGSTAQQPADSGIEPDTGTNPDDGATADTGTTAVTVTLSEPAFTLATPDLHHGLTATVTGSATTTVTWTSSNTYIATVSPAGIVTSVSGGDATITATSTADPTKSAACTVTVAEPNRAKAASYVDAKTITSGPIRIITAGDSLDADVHGQLGGPGRLGPGAGPVPHQRRRRRQHAVERRP